MYNTQAESWTEEVIERLFLIPARKNLYVASSAHWKLFFLVSWEERKRQLTGKDDAFHLSFDAFTAQTGPLLLHYYTVILLAIGKHLITSAQFSGFPFYRRKFVSLGQSSAIALWQISSVYCWQRPTYNFCITTVYWERFHLMGTVKSFSWGSQKNYFPIFFKRISVSWRPKLCLCPKAESYPQEFVPSEVERCEQHQTQTIHSF